MAYKPADGISYWNPNVLTQQDSSLLSEQNYCLIVLNHGLDDLESEEIRHFDRLWKSAKFRLAVDGGTNKLITLGVSYVPDCISGDFDSITESTLRHFQTLKVETIATLDQDDTDFTKALLLIDDKIKSKQLTVDYIVVIFQVNHRLDQTFASVSTLYKWNQKTDQCPVFLFDIKGSLSFLLPQGNHEIIANKVSNWCSVIPFQGSATISSTGLLYNMDALILSFNSIISTSNGFDQSTDKVTLQVHDKPVLWSQQFKSSETSDNQLHNQTKPTVQ